MFLLLKRYKGSELCVGGSVSQRGWVSCENYISKVFIFIFVDTSLKVNHSAGSSDLIFD